MSVTVTFGGSGIGVATVAPPSRVWLNGTHSPHWGGTVGMQVSLQGLHPDNALFTDESHPHVMVVNMKASARL